MLELKIKRRRIFLTVLCVILTLFFFQLQMAVKYKLPIIVTPIIYFLFYMLAIQLLIKNKFGQLFKAPGIWLISFYIFFLFLSSMNAEFQSRSFYQFIHIISGIVFYFLIIVIMRRFDDIKTFLSWILVAGVGILVIARTGLFRQYFPQKITRYITMSGTETVRESFLYLDVNTYAYMLSILMILILYQILMKKNSLWKNLCYTMISIVSCSSLIVTYSRGAILALVIGTFVMLIVSKKIFNRKVMTLSLLAITLVVIGFYATGIFQEMKHRVEEDITFSGSPQIIGKSVLDFRIEAAVFAMRMFAEKPLLGWGDSIAVDAQWRQRPSGNHVYYLNLLATRGVFVFVCFIMFFVIVFLHLKKGVRLLKMRENPNVNLGYLFLAIMTALAIKGLLAPIGEDFWIMSGISMAFYRIAHGNHDNTKNRKRKQL